MTFSVCNCIPYLKSKVYFVYKRVVSKAINKPAVSEHNKKALKAIKR